jgi:hypothetical protein
MQTRRHYSESAYSASWTVDYARFLYSTNTAPILPTKGQRGDDYVISLFARLLGKTQDVCVLEFLRICYL